MCSIDTAQTNLFGKRSKAHHYKLISTVVLDGISIAIVSLYTFVEFVSWYERYDLSEYSLSLIHKFCLL